jgi:hypothetical protein
LNGDILESIVFLVNTVIAQLNKQKKQSRLIERGRKARRGRGEKITLAISLEPIGNSVFLEDILSSTRIDR